MGNQQQAQTTQQTKTSQFDRTLEWLLQTQPTVSQFISCQPDEVSFTITCPKCKAEQFDDGLGRKINCYKCQVVYIVKDGIVEIQTELQVDERRTTPLLENVKNHPELTSLTLYCNLDTLPSELISGSNIDYKILLSKVIVPFFSIRQRFVQQGLMFNIGPFEFKVAGSTPKIGKVGAKTELYCYNSYTNSQNIQHLMVAPLKNKRLTGTQVSTDLKNYFSQYPLQNNLILDQQIKINNNDMIVILSQPGRITSETKVECLKEIPIELKEVAIICHKFPTHLNQFLNQKSVENGILKTVIIPYYTGFTRYVENGSTLQIQEFEFVLEVPEERGLVIPFKTNITLKLSRYPCRFRQLGPQGEYFEERKQQPLQQLNHQPIQRIQPRRQRLSFRNTSADLDEGQPQQQQQSSIFRRVSNPLQSQQPHQRLARNEQQIQQIEALHRLLNTFIMLNEGRDLEVLSRNQGATQPQINRLPERKIDLQFLKDRDLYDTDHSRCLICLVDYEDTDSVRTMPCLHYFHTECLDNWLVKNKTCPICKTSCDFTDDQ